MPDISGGKRSDAYFGQKILEEEDRRRERVLRFDKIGGAKVDPIVLIIEARPRRRRAYPFIIYVLFTYYVSVMMSELNDHGRGGGESTREIIVFLFREDEFSSFVFLVVNENNNDRDFLKKVDTRRRSIIDRVRGKERKFIPRNVEIKCWTAERNRLAVLMSQYFD